MIGMLTVNITYNAKTRLMKITSLSSGVGGDNAVATTGDNLTTRLQFTFDDPDYILDGYGARVDFGVNLINTDGISYRPFIVLDENDGVNIPEEILSNVKCGKLPIQLAFGQVIDSVDNEMYSLNQIELAINKAIDSTAESPVERYPQVNDAVMDVTYDDVTSTFTFIRIDGTHINVNLNDLSEEHYEVQHYADLETLTEAESGDTATVLDTGVWYKLYIQHGMRNWYPMSGNTTINGTQTGTPVFYAPYQSGTSGQYLESRGENNSPEWVTKVTAITGNSDTLPTTTAVKTYVDYNEPRLIIKSNSTPFYTGVAELPDNATQNDYAYVTGVENNVTFLDRYDFSKSGNVGQWTKKFRVYLMKNGQILNDWSANVDSSHIPSANLVKTYVDTNEPMLIIKSSANPFFTSTQDLISGSSSANQNDYAYITGVENNQNYLDHYVLSVSGSVKTWTKKYRIWMMKDGQLVSSFTTENTTDNTFIPSAKLVKDTIDNEVTRATGVESGLNDRISTLETETVNDGGRYLTKTSRTLDHDLTERNSGSDTDVLTNGGTATFIDLLSSNETGHVTASNTKTVTLPKVTAGTGITITDDDLPSPATGKQIIVGHSNSINAHSDADVGSANRIPIIRNDAQGHLTKVDSALVDIPTSQVTKLTGYAEASSEGQLNVNDTLNQALGKIQKGINSKARTDHADGTTDFGQATSSLYGHVKIVTATLPPTGTSNENVPTEAKMVEFVNSSIQTATADFLGTFDAVAELNIAQATVDTWTSNPTSAMETAVADALAGYLNNTEYTDYTTTTEYVGYYVDYNSVKTLVTSSNKDNLGIVPGTTPAYILLNPNNNDYVFISVNKTATVGTDWFWRFKYSDTDSQWLYEYTLNNSSFTAVQWATINSLLSNRSVTDTEHYPTPISLDVVDINNNITASTTHIADTTIHVTSQDKTDWSAKYDKPSTGIPKTDLDSSVQASLDLADSSIQAHQPIKTINSSTMVGTGNVNLQVPLVGSGTGQNIKTVGGTNILGTGDIPFPTVVNSNPSLTWATKSKVGSVGSTDLEVTMPSNPVIKTAIESALNVSGTYNNQALIVKNGVLDFGEAGKVDDVRINGDQPANSIVNAQKIAIIPITVEDITLTEVD